MKRKFLFIISLVITISAAAQEDRIEADRPSETISSSLVEKKTFQAELGLRREVEEDEITYSHPRTQLRYGLSKVFELRVELRPQTVKDRVSDLHESGLAPVEPGLKARIFEEKGARPSISFYTQVGIPKLASAAFKSTYASPKVRLLLENKLNENLKLSYNVGAEWTGEETEPQWLYTFSPEWQLGKHWEAFAEVYGFLQRNSQPQHSFDAGIAFYAGKNIKLDLSGGVGLTAAAPVNFVALGFSIRTGK
jgi:hypothetical protein